MRTDRDGNGIINIFRVTDIQSNTAMFSTFMLCLLAEIFQKLPEKGDVDKPELVIFFDEAHLIFNNATKTLLDHFETTIKLIRSKEWELSWSPSRRMTYPPRYWASWA